MKQFCLVASSILAVSSAAVGQVSFVEQPGLQEFTGEMLATPADDADPAQVAAALAPYRILEHAIGPNRYWIDLRTEGGEHRAADELMQTGLFKIVEPNWAVWPVDCPDDPLLGNQWHHNANRMNSCNGWDIHTGKAPVTVNICDTGVRRTHEDLRSNRREGYNAVVRKWERAGGKVDDLNGHGTATTGCAAADGNNSIGVAGVGWNLRKRMSRVSDTSGGGSSIAVLLHAAENGVENGDKVSSVSYSGVNSGSIRASATYIKSLGGLLVWAAGNDGANLNWGNRDNDDLIVAGATDSNDNKASFSAFGNSVDLVAPGVSVYTTFSSSDSAYGSISGTSFSCPLTAGLCALLFSADPSMSPDMVESILKAGCDDLGSSGVDSTYGYGRIDVRASLDLVSNVGEELTALMSFKAADSIGGVSFEPNDVLRYRFATQDVEMVFDCSDVLGTASNLNAVHQMDDGSLLMSFQDDAVTVPGVGDVNDEDIVQFIPTTLGDNTTGSFAMYFDGSDVGLGDRAREDIDGISMGENGEIYITPKLAWAVPGIAGKNEDVLEFTPTSLGSTTAGSWDLVFDGNDGSDERMGRNGEQIDALDLCTASLEFCFSTGGQFDVPKANLEGRRNDLLCYDIYSLSPGTGFMMRTLVGNPNGLSGQNIDALDIED